MDDRSLEPRENDRVDPNADSERQHDNDRKCGMPRHHSERVTKIASHRCESAAVNCHHPLVQAAMSTSHDGSAGNDRGENENNDQ